MYNVNIIILIVFYPNYLLIKKNVPTKSILLNFSLKVPGGIGILIKRPIQVMATKQNGILMKKAHLQL